LYKFWNYKQKTNVENPITSSTSNILHTNTQRTVNEILQNTTLKPGYNYYYYNSIIIIIKLIYFYRILNITDSTYEWPTPIQIQHQLKNLREFHQNFDYKLNHRIICSVCSRFYLTTTPQQFVQPLTILFPNKIILSSDNLVDCPSDKSLFEYNQFPQLNGMVLDKDGFNTNNTVKNCN